MGRLETLAEKPIEPAQNAGRLSGLATSTPEQPQESGGRLSRLAAETRSKQVDDLIERIIFTERHRDSESNVELQGDIAQALTEQFENPDEEIDNLESALLLSELFNMNINDALTMKPAMMKELYGDETASIAQRFKKTPYEGGFFSKIAESYRRGDATISADIALYEAAFEGRGSVQDVLNARRKVNENIRLNPVEGNFVAGLFYKSANIVPGMAKGYWDAIPEAAGGMVAAGVAALVLGQAGPQIALPEEAVTVPAASVLGLKAGLATGSAMFWYKQGAGSMYANMLENDYDPEVSRTVAGIAAMPYAVLEFLQWDKLAKGLSPTAAAEIRGKVLKSTQKTMLKVMGRAAKKYGGTLTTEVAEEIGQEFIQITAEDVAGILSDADIQMDKEFLAERMARLWETAKESTQAMALLPIPGSAIDIFSGARSVLSQKRQAEINSKLDIKQNIPVTPEAQAQPEEAAGEAAPVTAVEPTQPTGAERIAAQEAAGAVSAETTQKAEVVFGERPLARENIAKIQEENPELSRDEAVILHTEQGNTLIKELSESVEVGDIVESKDGKRFVIVKRNGKRLLQPIDKNNLPVGSAIEGIDIGSGEPAAINSLNGGRKTGETLPIKKPIEGFEIVDTKAVEGVEPKELPELRLKEDGTVDRTIFNPFNTQPLETFTDKLFRETNVVRALELMPTGLVTAEQLELFFANTENLALGQKENTGVLLEFESEGIKGKVNRIPNWQFVYQQGEAEFVSQRPDQQQLKDNLVSVTIKPDAQADKSQKRQMERALDRLEKSGWTKETLEDGSIKYTKKAEGVEPTTEGDLVEPLPTETVEKKVEPRIVKQETYDAARKRLTDQSKLRTGLDPSDVKDLVIIGAFHFENGVKSFAAFSKKMVSDIGEFVTPHLRDLYRRVVQNEIRSERAVPAEALEEFAGEKWASRAIVRLEKGLKLKAEKPAETQKALLAERQAILDRPISVRTPKEIKRLTAIEDELVARNIETFPDVDITEGKRKAETTRVTNQIIESDIYQSALEGLEDIPDLSGVFNVDSTEIGDVTARFEGRDDILDKFNVRQRGGERWDSRAAELGIEGGFDDFMDMVEIWVDAQKGDKINALALADAIASGDPAIALLSLKRDMLAAGFNAADINAEVTKLAELEGIPQEFIEDDLLDVKELTDVETKQKILAELVKKEEPAAKKKKKGAETEQAAVSRASSRAFKEKAPIFVTEKKDGKFSLSKKEPRFGKFIKVSPAEEGQAEGKIERLEADTTNIETEEPDNNLKQAQDRTQTAEWYAANTAKYKKSILDKGTDIAKATVKSIDRLIGVTSTRLELISPELFRRTRRHEYNVMTRTTEQNKRVEPFMKLTKKLSTTDLRQLDLAMKNSDQKKIDEIVTANNMTAEFAEVRTVLNEIFEAANQVGIDIDYRKAYIPRVVKDPKGFLEFFQKGDDWSIVRNAIEKKEQERGRVLTETERAAVVNTLLRGYTTSAISLARPGAAKERTVDVIDAEVNQFYHDFRVSLTKYIEGMNEKISSREFFGRQSNQIVKLRAQLSAARTRLAKLGKKQGLTPGAKKEQFTESIAATKERAEQIIAKLDRLGADDLSNSVGQFVIDEVLADNIKPSQEKEVRDLLMGLFDPKSSGTLLGNFKALLYIDVLGSFLNTVTQLEELGLAFYRDPLGFVPEAVKATINLSEITTEDLGITSIGEEFKESDARKALGAILSITGFQKIDQIGKQTFINTVVKKMQRQARSGDKALIDRLRRVFGDDFQQVVEDLKSGEVTDNVKYLAFNQILDIQPLALSEMPEAYNRAGNLRIFFALKTFMIKQLDFVRTEALQDMKRPETFMRGFGRLMWLSFSLALFGAGADALKDFIRGRPFDLLDSVVDTFLRRIFFSKFQYSKAMREGFGRSFLEGFIPPTKLIDAVTRDIKSFGEKDVKDFEFWRSVPIVGEPYYWWFGAGREKALKEQRQEKTKRKPLF